MDSDVDGDSDADPTCEDAEEWAVECLAEYCEGEGSEGAVCICLLDDMDVDEETCDCGDEVYPQEFIDDCEATGAAEFFSNMGCSILIDIYRDEDAAFDEACGGEECDEECTNECLVAYESCLDLCAEDPDCEAVCEEDVNTCGEECGCTDEE